MTAHAATALEPLDRHPPLPRAGDAAAPVGGSVMAWATARSAGPALPPPSVVWSGLGARLAVVAPALALLWLAVAWALAGQGG
ncbi:hypothetical protein [Ideonella livida]|uniref:Uncharacterized protein n=1 Tax=Ideonella livida TaxID=2707176 RepID=A0A7C9PH11_9BURK|nr:hypothetical protein [Ideonella livida]NDY91757.1 hypothetical protein [Ideonella livida]